MAIDNRNPELSPYRRKLLDPRWQMKRLRIMERDMCSGEVTCQMCGDTTTTFNVHHRDYEPGRDPWDYPDSWLVTLCAPCHEEETECRSTVEGHLLRALKRGGATYLDVESLCCGFEEALGDATNRDKETLLSAFCEALCNKAVRDRIVEEYRRGRERSLSRGSEARA